MQIVDASVRVLQPSITKSVPPSGTWPRFAARGRTTLRQQILVVDDDLTVQEVLTFFLRGAYDGSHATTGANALMKLHRDPVDLVILDHRLPDRTGLDILRELKSIRLSLPVIMMTGYGSEWICAAAFKLGVTDYLQKPVSAGDLVGAVKADSSTRPQSKRPPVRKRNDNGFLGCALYSSTEGHVANPRVLLGPSLAIHAGSSCRDEQVSSFAPIP